MIDNIERRQQEFRKAKTKIHKMYPEARLRMNPRAGYYIEDGEGRNILAQSYPDLAFADNVMSAYINLDIVSHWNKIETRNSRKFRNDVKSVCVVGDGGYTSKRFEDYIEHTPDHITSDGQPEE